MTPSPNWRAALAFVHDLCAAALAWSAIYWLRFNLEFREPYYPDMASGDHCVNPECALAGPHPKALIYRAYRTGLTFRPPAQRFTFPGRY